MIFTKYIFVDPGTTFQSTNHILLFVKVRLATRVRLFYVSVIHQSFPFGFRDMLWVGLCLGVGMRLGLNF